MHRRKAALAGFSEAGMIPNRFPRIVMISAEAYPYAKVGGLGDVVGSLPKKLEMLGAEITVLIPAYKSINHDRFGVHLYKPLPAFDVKLGSNRFQAEVCAATMPGSNVRVFFLGNPEFFLRDGIYDDPHTHEGYTDNMERFIFFTKACLSLLPKVCHQVDILHCHDWQTGLIPGIIKTTLRHNPFFSPVATILTIHNLAYQGIFPKIALSLAGIGDSYFFPGSPFEYWGKVNFLKAGIEYSDCVTTVSENYALEIQSDPAYGYGLEGVLRKNRDKLRGIVNGIDFKEWNPETDPFLPANFSSHNLSGKLKCKNQLLQYFGLAPQTGRVPLIGVVSRLADQKGFDLMAGAFNQIFGMELQMVILGTGQRKYHELLKQMAASYPEKFAYKLAFDNRLAHQIEGGADMTLMPSRYEPCGLNQLYGMRYGTVPIVRATGGLADTVVNYEGQENAGTGFSFKDYAAKEMVGAVSRALQVYSNPQQWEKIVIRGMKEDWSWESSAHKYLELYKRICKSRSNHNAPA
ncbi:MAG: glgA [Acidobacteria bacterium]|nr:glgA [Acidobacteriota bacterium]